MPAPITPPPPMNLAIRCQLLEKRVACNTDLQPVSATPYGLGFGKNCDVYNNAVIPEMYSNNVGKQ